MPSMDDNTTPNTNMAVDPTPQWQPQPKKSKAGKVVLWVLLVIILVAGAVAGGWYIGNMEKEKAVENAKRAATQQAQEATKKDSTEPTTPQGLTPKTATETTCNADELSLALSTETEGAAGTITHHLTLQNISTRTCILGGFPGVSLVNENGNMIGSPAERAKNYEEKKLTLAPKKEVMIELAVSNSTNFTDGQCKEGATKFRVYPPNDYGYVSVSSGNVKTWCPGFTTSPVLQM